jgi:hypothetical protein
MAMNFLSPHSLTSFDFALGNARNGRPVVCLTPSQRSTRDARNSAFLCCSGRTVGTRFKVLVIIPAAVLVLVTTISFGIAARWDFHDVATTLLISIVALQVGYVTGSLVSHFASAVRFKRTIVCSRDITFSQASRGRAVGDLRFMKLSWRIWLDF